MSVLTLSSRAMFSSWCYHKPTRTLFDAGEGVSLYMLTGIFGIEQIFLSHGHSDHIGGMANLIGLRSQLKGDTQKPLTIYYPEGNTQIARLKEYITASWSDLPYELSWIGIKPEYRLALSPTLVIESFPMAHQRNGVTLGYRIIETRRRLKAAHVCAITLAENADGETPFNVKEYLDKVKALGEDPYERYLSTKLCYCLDHYQMDRDYLCCAETAIMDCTFLDIKDRLTDENTAHASLEESARLCAGVGVKHMIAGHQSLRNNIGAVQTRAQELAKQLDMQITVCDPSSILNL